MMDRRCVFSLLLLLGGWFAPAAPAAHSWFTNATPLFVAGSGAAEIFDAHREVYWTLEYRPAFRWYHVGPWFSIGTGRHDEFYAALGILVDIELGRNWVLTPGFGGGYYSAARGLDLGFDAQFRSGFELSKRLPHGQRLGIAFSHLSNGSLSRRNPGTETLGINYGIPLDRLFRWRRAPSTPTSSPPPVE